jgi:hypothetical protein
LGALGQRGSIAVIERLIRTMKHELLLGMPIPLRYVTLQHQIYLRIGWYNEQRPHTSLRGQTPNEVPDSREIASPWKFSSSADSVPCRSSLYAARPEPSNVVEALPRRMVCAGRHPKSDERTLPTPSPLAPSSILQLGLAESPQ